MNKENIDFKNINKKPKKWSRETMNLLISSTDMYGEKFSKKYNARLEKKAKGRRYLYKDENTQVSIYVLEKKIRITRKGEIESTQIITEESETIFPYKAPYLQKNFKISTKKLEILEKEVDLRYSIYDGDSLVNEIEMKIREI